MRKKYLLLLLGFVSVKLFAQKTGTDSINSKWKFSAWAEYFIVPGDESFFNPTFYADGKKIHLEGRYNYEAMNTASIFAGWNFNFGKAVKFEITPIAGIVFGSTDGMATGLEIDIEYKKFDFYSESEHVFDFAGKENNFFYMYSELAINPIKQLRLGLLAQRTRLYESDREIQRGVLAEYYFGRCRAGVFYFDPFTDNNFVALSFSVDF